MINTTPKFNGTDLKDIWYKKPLSVNVDKAIIMTTRIIGKCKFKTILLGENIYYKFK